MRPDSILSALLLPAALLLAHAPAHARPHQARPHQAHPHQARPHQARPHPRPASDMDATLARMAERDRLAGWRDWQARRPLVRALPPVTRERVAAPPFTGWGYGGTIPGARPGF